MGSFGYTLELERAENRERETIDLPNPPPRTRGEFRKALLYYLSDIWKDHLPRDVHADAQLWFRAGDDSLLTIDREDQPDEVLERVTFWFYDTVYWAHALAEHWLRKTLRDHKSELESMFFEQGYVVNGDWFSDQHDGRHFFVDGDRIGYLDEVGFWQYPEATTADLSTLDPEIHARAVAVRDGAPCECPWCR